MADESRFHQELHSAVMYLRSAEQGQRSVEEATERALDCLGRAENEPPGKQVAYGKLLVRAHESLVTAEGDFVPRAIGDIKAVLGDLHRTEPCQSGVE